MNMNVTHKLRFFFNFTELFWSFDTWLDRIDINLPDQVTTHPPVAGSFHTGNTQMRSVPAVWTCPLGVVLTCTVSRAHVYLPHSALPPPGLSASHVARKSTAVLCVGLPHRYLGSVEKILVQQR